MQPHFHVILCELYAASLAVQSSLSTFCVSENYLTTCTHNESFATFSYSRQVVLTTEHYAFYLTARIAFDPSRGLCVIVRRLTGVCDPSK